jgi:alkylation response protein AidB-like acyl-CoA dehydrogenase
MPFPEHRQKPGDRAVADEKFCRDRIDPIAIDRESQIPDSVIRGLGDIGVLGFTIAPALGGRGLSQMNYCRVMEVIGAHCAATAVFVNAHHSIGLRALQLLPPINAIAGCDRWPKPGRGCVRATESEAGSTLKRVIAATTRMARFHLNGTKLLDHQWRHAIRRHGATPDPATPTISFLGDPDNDFEVLSAWTRSALRHGNRPHQFTNMFVPARMFPPMGTTARSTVLDFGRTTFGAAPGPQFCIERMANHCDSSDRRSVV